MAITPWSIISELSAGHQGLNIAAKLSKPVMTWISLIQFHATWVSLYLASKTVQTLVCLANVENKPPTLKEILAACDPSDTISMSWAHQRLYTSTASPSNQRSDLRGSAPDVEESSCNRSFQNRYRYYYSHYRYRYASHSQEKKKKKKKTARGEQPSSGECHRRLINGKNLPIMFMQHLNTCVSRSCIWRTFVREARWGSPQLCTSVICARRWIGSIPKFVTRMFVCKVQSVFVFSLVTRLSFSTLVYTYTRNVRA